MLLWTDAYMADTSHLTTFEHGAYLLILIAMWRAGGHLPNDDIRLARSARMTPGKWAKIAPTIRQFLTVNGDTVTQKRLMVEISNARCRKTQIAFAGHLGGIAKSLKYNKPPPSDATQTPLAKVYPLKPEEREKQNLKVLQKNTTSRKFKHELPEGWEPDDGDISYGKKLGLIDGHFGGQLEAMLLWAKANKILKADWHATLKGFLRSHAEKVGVAAPSLAAAGTLNGHVFVKRFSPQWNAWSAYYWKTKGKSPPSSREGGWNFPSEYPPEIKDAAE